MKILLSIFLVLTTVQSFCQKSDSVRFVMNGIVRTYQPNLVASNPTINVYFGKENHIKVIGDSLGNFSIDKVIKSDTNKVFIVIDGIDHYKQKIIKVSVDTLDVFTVYELKLDPELICIDTRLPPDIIFNANATNISYLISGTGDSYNMQIDSVLVLWVENWEEEFAKSDWNTKIVIKSYADYSENKSLSRQRMNLIYDKLIEFGVPSDILVKSNKGKQPREYYKYRDGCHPYYLIKNQPTVIDKNYIDYLSDEDKIHPAHQLRRAVTFEWKFE